MVGFFTKQQTASVTRPDGKQLSCNSCGLYKGADSPKMEPYGNFKKGIMLIGEAPNMIEDQKGKPWQGRSGVLLQQTMKGLGIDLFEDCISLNAVNCRPKTDENKNRIPVAFEVDCCRRIVLQVIKQYKPKVIILLSVVALQSVIGSRFKKDLGGIHKWTGWTIPDQGFTAWVCPVIHPSLVLHENRQEVESVWRKDLQRAIDCIDKPFPVYQEPTIEYLDTDLSALNTITGEFAFDYETTGLKSNAEKHEIVCAAVSDAENHVYTFMIPKKRGDRLPLINLLKNESIGKIGCNIKFEHNWTLNRLNKTIISNWIWDTMLAAHVLDNRTGITGLKFQVYTQFGIPDYSSEVQPYLVAESSNSLNQLQTFVKSKENAMKVMKYCALDANFTFRLKKLQEKQLRSE